LMLRERLTGQAAPKSAERIVELWRPFIEERAGDNFAGLRNVLGDQRAFAHAARDLLVALEMGEELGGEPEESDEENDSERSDSSDDKSSGEADETDAPDQASPREPEATGEDEEAGEAETADSTTDDIIESDD